MQTLQLPRFMHATYLVEKVTILCLQDITDFTNRLLNGCTYCNMCEENFIECCGKPLPDYLVHPLYFPEADALEWPNVSIGWRFAPVPRILNDQWCVNLTSGDIWVNTSSTTYFA